MPTTPPPQGGPEPYPARRDRGHTAIQVADVVVEAALGVDGVAHVTAGPGGYSATYGVGRRIEGVRIRRRDAVLDVQLSVTVRYPSTVSAVAEEVHDRVLAALRALEPDGSAVVGVRVVDLVLADAEQRP